ncbi:MULTISPECIES: putative hydro-lyase [Delftia]|uniref:Putative hydro-lyase PYR84_22110 n=1 Tax=Delftia tsuruhatensis TaxID=180282 RepID=A0AAX3SHV7_9BURK|nr:MULTISPECIES: putative hydro-lyase [Delftia]WEM01192.1 putative hydro-lyase [Delftia tsuruhatensis]WFF79604.1 putative hydro-lyase [Delftia tsuruhatensis]WQM84940.1 putative hydro-lyase [Delftia tsuruhatensis]
MTHWTHPTEFRQEVRAGRFRGQTAGQCPGYTQGNLAILPRECSEEFLRFARLNPKSCPLIGVTEPGSSRVPELGDIDLKTDLPSYWVFRDGHRAEQVNDLTELWRDDLVGFVIGCSYSFEDALREAGVPVRHIGEGRGAPMFITDIANGQAGRFGGRMVVSMRPMTAAHAIRAIQVTSRFPSVHGAPVHLGDPAQIGIADIDRPDFGEPMALRPGEIPVFWACGVTPQQAIRSAALPFAITHEPGHMLVTELRNSHLAAF